MSEPASTTSFVSSITDPADGATGGAVTITDFSHLTKLVVKTTPARPDGLGPRFGSGELVGDALVCGTRPGEWTVIGPAGACAAAVGPATETSAHVIDITHGLVLIQVAGPAAASALEKVCSLDWSDDMMPDGAVTSGSVAKVSCDVIRHDGHSPAYWIAADRSFGQYLYEALVDAAAEFG